MKTIKTTLAILALTFLSISCSKDDPTPAPTVYPEENPIPTYLTNTGFSQESMPQITNPVYYDNYGFAFKPKVNGTINSIVIKLPTSDADIIVRIWKVSTQALLKSVPVLVATNNLEVTTSIEKLPLLKDEEYIITMRTNSLFFRRRTDNAAINFPIVINNIKITGNTNTVSNTYPGINEPTTTNKYFGNLSFNFQQTE